jgi:hypothetical protein
MAQWMELWRQTRYTSLSRGDRAGDYLIEQELPDGRLLLRPDPAYPTVVPVFDGRAATIEEFGEILGALSTDGEG